MKPILSIIIPSLRPQKLLDCILNINLNTHLSYEIICVVDDFDRFDKIPLLFGFSGHTIKFIKDDKCIGTTYPIQLGLEQSSGTYIVALSDDALPQENWADNMYSFLDKQNNSIPLIGSFVVYDETGELGNIGYYGRSFSPFPFIRKDNIDKIGGYYETKYNAYFADPSTGIRCWEAGGKVLVCPEAKIYHKYNPDTLHLSNKDKYWEHDESIFKETWKHLGEFTGCQRIPYNV